MTTAMLTYSEINIPTFTRRFCILRDNKTDKGRPTAVDVLVHSQLLVKAKPQRRLHGC
ncbi:hypothetical protein HanXRQr2_Chr14g0623261 [Helianthus annuus]|uniref:Uncharacterized protein n=1 Tax=Helianthus annuus TaxID=4232 RepID=A0A251SDX2_HELAN|nr:hypothetical protein HanXRQr2_Chr14g0623261 [Helianthus annuus]KAJ0484267.1 hypothetical protein HanHA89_Chr14g0542201 [Helianthus annuus]